MGSVIVLSLLVVATFVVLCYVFSDARIELDSPTIAAMEARAEAEVSGRSSEMDDEPEVPAPAESEQTTSPPAEVVDPEMESVVKELPVVSHSEYEYRETLEEGGENYVIPQWMVNFFSSSNVCHTLDASDNVIMIVKLNDARAVDAGIIDMSAECDMSTQTVGFKMCFGQGAAAETVSAKFYLFERDDLFELNRLVRQSDLRIDILTRTPDYTLQYARSVHTEVSQEILTQLRTILTKVPS